MSFRRKILTIFVILLLAAAVVLAVLSILNQRKLDDDNVILPQVDENISQQNLPAGYGSDQDSGVLQADNLTKKIISQEEQEKNFLLKTARAFAERFGSFSNQSNYENIKDLKVFMTQKMWSWAQNTIKQGQISNIYYGITTRALNSQIDSQTSSKATVRVSTQRQETVGSQINSRVIYKDILIVFEKEGGVWKVSGAYWQ